MAGPILLDLLTPHPCPSSILKTSWGEPSYYLCMKMGRGLLFLSMPRISAKNKSQEKISSDSSSRLIKINLMTYHQLMKYLEDKADSGPLEAGLYRFKCIQDHKGPYTPSDPEYNGSSYNLLIEWETGEQTWETKDNNKWKEATVHDKNHIINIPKGHQKIRVHFLFDANQCGKFKDRLVAHGHFTKEPMETVYSGMFLADPNNLELWGADGEHNLQGLTREKLYTVGDSECWHDNLFETLHQMGFKPSRADPDTWMKYSKDGSHYEHIAVYVDDLAICMKDTKSFCDILKEKYKLKLREVAPINYHLGCGYIRDEDNPTNTLDKYWRYASIWPLLKPLLFWKGDTDELNAKTKGSDRIPAKKSLMDEGQARNPNTTYNGYKMEFWKFALTCKLICQCNTKITKTTKRNNKERRISSTIMDQKSIYNSIHKPQRSPKETIGFNQDGHPYRMCNETGIPEFLELQISGIPMVVMVTSRACSLRDPTQQDFINARTLPIYKSHTRFKF